ncbi:hypothetical protein DDB_G0271178 [Dictyostelium discoideum AX4]|uniref:Uncharacterized protein csb family protein DDB_G0271178 n=1 Tax=Dictyostelium discoideum TaxID=44689 RepID=CSBL4_DICDI|nr:hypothetical protein DDB_G0271178 [Dictyostelium discoideum AX4]Q55B51.1 RecName: Full=Uncharacterized protein csb family protein DDB_G0271178 [Dictyostelium discoideum]EAL71719.1 hypothetical protein DDB_G0271178 [Dictyostelium discoideum AX4]|eukprot:XP_645761.1 hypothetical protein DDB_G0271178 [Dictyostelium discoideum AX4]
MAEEVPEFKITIFTDKGRSTISGTEYPLPILPYPAPYTFRLSGYTIEGPILTNKEFKVITGKIEYGGEEFDIPPSSKGSWRRADNLMNLIFVTIYLSRQPKKVFHY